MGKRFLTYYTEDAEAGNIPVDGNGVMQPSLISAPSDTLTWDGNTEGLISMGNDDMKLYRVSGLVPSADEMNEGLVIRSVTGIGDAQPVSMGVNGLMAAASTNDETSFVIFVSKEAVGVVIEGGMMFTKPGIYFTSGVRALTINGYTGFVGKTLNPAWGISKAEAVADAAGSTPTAEEFNALLNSLRNAGYLKV